MSDDVTGIDRFPWAGPALFSAVLVAVLVFFWWFVTA